FVDSHTVLELAAVHAAPDPRVPVIVYGLDDLSVPERRFLERVIRDRPGAFYLPYCATPAFQWTQPLRDDLLALGFREQPLAPLAASNALTRLQQSLFDDSSSHSADVRDDDDSLLILSAPDRPSETEDIVREIVHSPLASRFPAGRVAILLRETEPYAPLLRDELARAGLRGFIERTLTDTDAGRALALLLPLLDEEFRRAEVMEFLLGAPVRFHESPGGSESLVPAAEWNHFSLLAGIVAGEAAWEDGLRRLHHQLSAHSRHRDDDDAPADTARLASLIAMRAFLTDFFARIRQLNSAVRWSDRAAALTELFADLIGEVDGFAEVRERLRRTDALDALAIPPTAPQFAAALRAILSSPAAREGRFQIHDPAVVTYTEALGARFDEIVLPGVVEKEIPRPPSSDPLLLNDERQALTELGLLALPERDRQRERERFLFTTTLSSANRRALLSFPRREADKGRERLPSSYLLDVAHRLTGRRISYTEIERLIRTARFARRVPAGPLQFSDAERAVTDFRYDVARIAEALHNSAAEPIADLAADHPLFARAVEAEQQRFRRRDFSRFDGVVENEPLRRRLTGLAAGAGAPVSATRFETYAHCPFQYFVRHMLGLEEIEEPSAIRGLRRRERGLLIHEILERFFRTERDAARLPLDDDAENRIRALAAQVFRRYSEDDVFGLPLLWKIAQDEMIAELTEFVRCERAEFTRFIPAHFEVAYGMAGGTPPSSEEPLRITLGNGRDVYFHGRIDRIDVDPDGPARVVDYKTGKPMPKLADGRLCGGRALQLPVYRLAAEALLHSEVAVAEYRYVSSAEATRRIGYSDDDWQTAKQSFLFAVATIHEGISLGRFYPYPDAQKCSACFARAACGAGRETHKWRERSADTESFLVMAEQIP
ncbi:MAG: PD-(D/E)XK nuclease family protein, partial [bacterium]|nr:PD-(D/E)XK nuclease family protein [bacterium]